MNEILPVLIQWMSFDRMVEALGFVVGLFYIYYEYNASPRLWLVSIIMPMISLWVYFRAGIYADFGINIYYLAMAVYGYAMWTRQRHATASSTVKASSGESRSQKLRISRFPLRQWPALIGVTTLIYLALAYVLIQFTDSNVPWADAFTTALNIVGTWMLARKYLDQWFLWLAVEVVSVWLYIYKGIYFYAALYSVYTVICIFGYFKWCRMMAEGK